MGTRRRHPAQVTADRLGDHYQVYCDLMTGAERDALSHVKFVLEQIADGKRAYLVADGHSKRYYPRSKR